MVARALTILAAFVFATPLLVGCQQEGVVVTDLQDYPLSTKSLRSFVANNGGFGLATVNGPQVPNRAEADRTIASLLKVPGRPDIPVTPVADSRDYYRIVLVFNPPNRGGINTERVCSGNIGALPTQVDPGVMRIFGAVCATDRIVSHALTTSADIAPSDPRFQAVADAMMVGLFPHIPRGDRADCNLC